MDQPSNQFDKLGAALVAFQAELSPVEKSAANPFFKSKYAPLPEVRQALQPILAKHKLALLSFPAIVEGKNGLKFYLMHESGQFLSGEWMLNPVKNDPQAEGSATTYLRRYGDMAITGMVADEDDDGNAASHDKPVQRQKVATVPGATFAAKTGTEVSVKQLGMIQAKFMELGIEIREEKMAYVSQTIGREVESSKELTKSEAVKVIDRLINDIEAQS